MNATLSICIPTANRADVLAGCLDNLIPQASRHSIEIHVSDNASTDNTGEVVRKYQKDYPHLKYSRNPVDVGAVENIRCALRLSKSRYSLLFGDKYRLFDGALDRILPRLAKADYDMALINAIDRVRDIKDERVYIDHSGLMADLGWHVTLISCTVWSREMALSGDFDAFKYSELMHVGVIFKYLAGKPIKVLWDPRLAVYSSVFVSGWLKKTFDVFIERWIKLINSLPSAYSDEAKRKCVMDHGVKSGIFTFKGFLALRLLGAFNFSVYMKHRKAFGRVSRVPPFVIFLLSALPVIRIPTGIAEAFARRRVSRILRRPL